MELVMPAILTASWSAELPVRATAVGISRGVPRGRAGHRRLRELEPGPWSKSVPPERYLVLYREILDRLDPNEIHDRLFGYGDTPVMLCWESAVDCHDGTKWCHRHLAARWLEDRLGIEVREVGHPDLDRFAFLRNSGIQAPSFKDARRLPGQRIASDND
jgi:hypothetical protein